MIWRGGDAEPLGAFRHGRIVDRWIQMRCSLSSRSLAALHLSGHPTKTGTIWDTLDITGSPAASSADLVRPAQFCCRSRSQFSVLHTRRIAMTSCRRSGEARSLSDEVRSCANVFVDERDGQPRRGAPVGQLNAGALLSIATLDDRDDRAVWAKGAERRDKQACQVSRSLMKSAVHR